MPIAQTGLEASRIDSRSLGNSWHRDFAALTESVYKLELLPVALYDADDACASVTSHEKLALPRVYVVS